MRRKKTTDQYAEEKRWVSSFDLKDDFEHFEKRRMDLLVCDTGLYCVTSFVYSPARRFSITFNLLVFHFHSTLFLSAATESSTTTTTTTTPTTTTTTTTSQPSTTTKIMNENLMRNEELAEGEYARIVST